MGAMWPAVARSDFLFARPSWLSGFARLIDLFGVFDAYNESRTPQEADACALHADWFMVGQELYSAYQNERTASGRQGELFQAAAEA